MLSRAGNVPCMSTRLVHIVIDAAHPVAQARFWAAALDWEADGDDDEAGASPSGFSYPGPDALPLVFVPVPEPKTVKNRVHLDLASDSSSHQQALVSHLLDLGATAIDIGQGNVPWTVLADPEGNEFCVLEPRPVYRDTGPVAAVVVDSSGPASLADFWQLAAGWGARADRTDVVALRSGAGTGPYLEFLSSSDPRTVKNRVHLDVAPFRADDHAAAVAALREAGAVPADVGQGEATWAVLADPEGNEFCVLSPR
jgi:predicted enzyme related to lactoylglutathione lyase